MLRQRVLQAVCAAFVLAGFGAATPAGATAINYTYGTFAIGFVGGGGAINLSSSGYGCYAGAGTCYYNGTSNTPSVWSSAYPNFGPATNVSGSAANGSDSASSSANLTTGDISVQVASASGAYAQSGAGFFTQITFQNLPTTNTVTISMSGALSGSGSHTAWAGLNLAQGLARDVVAGFNGYYDITSACSPPTSVCSYDGANWSLHPTFSNVQNGVTYTLYAFLNVLAAGDFHPGSATMTDPFNIILPEGGGFVVDAPNFLTGVPEPASLALLAGGLPALALVRRRRR